MRLYCGRRSDDSLKDIVMKLLFPDPQMQAERYKNDPWKLAVHAYEAKDYAMAMKYFKVLKEFNEFTNF